MAYVNQDKKSKIAAALKAVVPAGWKYSLAVRHHSTIVMTITQAPFDLIAAFKPSNVYGLENSRPLYLSVNPYHYRSHIADECVADVFGKIFDALNTDNHDRSDVQTDYFDVGHYVDVNLGRWNKPFEVVETNPVKKFCK